MGYNCYVNNALLPTVRMMQEAYKNGMVSLTDLHLGILDIIGGDNGNHGDHQNGDHHKEESRNEEKLPPCTPFLKEEKRKEENALSLSLARKEILPIPSFDEITQYATKFENLTFTPEYFFHHYNALGWKVRGEMIENWQSLFKAWVSDPKKRHHANPSRADLRQQRTLTAETRQMQEAERQTAEREQRLRKQASESCSYAEYQRMKREGRV